MRWSERQLAMLREMGIHLWLPSPRHAAEALVQVDDEPQASGTLPSRAAVAAPAVAPRAAQPARAERAPPTGSDALAASAAAMPAVRVGVSAADIASMDWSALQAAVAGCRACALCDSRTQPVFGVGHPQAHWMVVGEAPGEHEDRQGEPFVGPSGRLLDNMLRAIGVSRGDAGVPAGDPARHAYIANALKCRPPGNRNPAPGELAQCEAYLVRQVELVRPRIILAMGRFAVQSLLRSSEPIGRLRGRVHRYHGVPLVVTYHPAYLLRNLQDKARAWDDLCLARQTLEAQDADPPPPPAS